MTPLNGERLRQLYHRKVLNQELSLEEYAARKVVLKSRPSKLLIELTQNCNYRCVMCNQSLLEKYKRYNPSLNMSLEIFDKAARDLFDDVYFVDLRGFGESVILPYWPDLVDRLEDYPLISWHLVTNLSLPRDATWEKMIKSGFVLGFSCDGASKEVFEAIRVRSNFETILHNLEVVSNSIKRHNRGLLYFIVTVQKRNIAELPAIVELANRFGVREVQFKAVKGGDRHDEALTADMTPALTSAVSRSLALAMEFGIRLTINDEALLAGIDRTMAEKVAVAGYAAPPPNWPPPSTLDPEFTLAHPWTSLDNMVRDTWRVSEHKKCFKAFHFTYIASDGRVGPCNHLMNPDVPEMGNLNNQTFEEIWNGEDYQFFRASMLRHLPPDSRCVWCFSHRLED